MKLTSYLILAALLAAAAAYAQLQYLTPWWIDTGETDTTGLGISCAPLGDINGDGLNDFIVGGWAEELYVYLGNTQPDTIPYMVIPSPDTSVYWFGIRLFSVGDANGDGYSDFVAQATLQEGFQPEHFYAYLFFGGPVLDTYPDLVFDGGANPSSDFGFFGAGIGNYCGGAENEFVILDPQYAVTSPIFGRIYIYHGGALLDSIPDYVINADSAFNYIGMDVAPLDDINNDGFADFAASHPQCQGEQGQEDAGIIEIFYGGSQPDTIPQTIIRGTELGEHLGSSIATLDYDRDGQLDIIAGDYRVFPPDHYSSIYLYLVSETMSGQPDCIFPDNWPGLSTGDGLLGMDYNGDGWQDIVSCNPHGLFDTGIVYAYFGGSNADSLVDAIYFPNSHIYAGLGSAGCNPGDMNGDGVEDLVVGEAGYGDYYEQIDNGRIHVILGDTSFHQSVGILPTGPPSMPGSTLLLRAYPIPFNSLIIFHLDYSSNESPKLRIYNLVGNLISEIHLQRGQRQAFWNGLTAGGQSCTSGIYLARLTAGGRTQTVKFVLLK